MPQDSTLPPLVLLMLLSIQPLSTSLSSSRDGAGDAARSLVVAVGAVDATVDSAVVDVVVIVARRVR